MFTQAFKRRTIHIGVLCLLLWHCVMNPGLAANTSQDEEKSKKEEAKHPDALSKPKKTEYDKLALKPLVMRANSGDVNAQFELGSRLNYGRDMPKNTEQALRWLQQAAEGGNKEAQSLLAMKFYNGFDVTPDHAEAFRWTSLLADTGDVPAQFMLANMFANGEGVERNLIRAHMWYNIASANAGKEGITAEAGKAAQDAVEAREKITALLLPDQESEAQRLASDWWLQKQGTSLDEKEAAPDKVKSSTRKASASPKNQPENRNRQK